MNWQDIGVWETGAPGCAAMQNCEHRLWASLPQALILGSKSNSGAGLEGDRDSQVGVEMGGKARMERAAL